MHQNKHSIFYRGIAKEVSLSESDESILKKSGLDWEPKKRDYFFGEGNNYKKSSLIDCIYRSDTGKEIAAVTKNWNIYENQKMLQDVRAFCSTTGLELEAAGLAFSGSTNGSIGGFLVPFFSVVIQKQEKPILSVGEEISQQIIFANPIAQNQAIFAEMVSLRLICLNGSVLPQKLKQVTIRHNSPNLEEKVDKLFRNIMIADDKYKLELERLADTPLTEEAAMVILTKLFGDREKTWGQQPLATRTAFDIYLGEYDNLFEDQGVNLGQSSLACFKTGYGLYNAVTAYNSHFRGYAQSTSHSAFLSMVRGTQAKDNRRAFSEISSWCKQVKERQAQYIV